MSHKKNFFKRVSITVAACLMLIGSAQAAQITWRNVDAGLQEGKQSHKYILVDVYTDWCGWCKHLDKTTFTNPELKEFLNNKFVSVKANAEDGGAGQKLATQYGVNGYPCALVFDSNGTLIGRFAGYKDAIGYENALRDIIDHPARN